MEILCDYSRYFIKKKYTDDFAPGLMALEPATREQSIQNTLRQFETMQQQSIPKQWNNWRFRMALERTTCDE